jgi:hypothetical protein
MKKYAAILSLLALTLMVGCSKEKRCMCTSTQTLDAHNNPQVTYIHVDNGFRCSKITQIGYERLIEGQLIREWDNVVCEDAKD